MSDAVVQKGTQLVVGIGGFVYAGYIVENVGGPKPMANEKVILDENGATTTIIISDPWKEIKLAMIVKAGSDPTTIAIGDTITINAVNYRVTAVDPQRIRGEEMKVTIDAKKETSMSYS